MKAPQKINQGVHTWAASSDSRVRSAACRSASASSRAAALVRSILAAIEATYGAYREREASE